MNEIVAKSSKIMLFMVLVAMGHAAEGDFRSARRGGTNMGLFPFPRVGRADPSILNTYSDIHEGKRQGLIPFPRVGRGPQLQGPIIFPSWLIDDETIEYQKRNVGNNVKGGMWFGPRLGRLQKRSVDYNDVPWALVALQEPVRQAAYMTHMSQDETDENEEGVVEAVLSRRIDSKTGNNLPHQ